MKKIRVFLVDGNRQYLYAAEAKLATLPNVVVVGMATAGETALEEIQMLAPDLVFMSLVLPGMSGLRTMRAINALPVATRVILLSMDEEADYSEFVISNGGIGMISKANFAYEAPVLLNAFVQQPRSERGLAA